MDGTYSLTRLLNAQQQDAVHKQAPYELAESDRIAEECGRQPEPGYCYVPVSRRDLTAGVGSAGGYLVGTETAPGDVFVGALHASSVMARMGIARLGLVGNATVPRTSGSVSTYWLPSEGTTITESNFTFTIGAATPKNVGAYTEVSGQWLKQSSTPAQNFVLTEMARATAAAMDSAIIGGTGASGQPLGILSTSGIGTTTGAALSWPGIADMLNDVEGQSALVVPERAGWVGHPGVAQLLRQRVKFAGTNSPIWTDQNTIGGYSSLASNSVPANALLFGDWSGVALLEWGTLQVSADPYGVNSALFKSNMAGIRALWTCDLVVLRPKSFTKAESVS
jgi:HK97 family phage major capsid protein